MHHQFQVGEATYQVWLSRRGSGYVLHFDGAEIPVTPPCEADRIVIATRGDEVHVHLDGAAYTLRYRHPLENFSHDARGAADDCVRAPMPGVAIVIHVEAGREVARGDALLVMESMKLETTIVASRDCVIQAVHVAQGQTFERDAPLVTLAAAEPAP